MNSTVYCVTLPTSEPDIYTYKGDQNSILAPPLSTPTRALALFQWDQRKMHPCNLSQQNAALYVLANPSGSLNSQCQAIIKAL